MSLVDQISSLATAIRDKLNTMVPRLLPPGGTADQMLTKTSNEDYITAWEDQSVKVGISLIWSTVSVDTTAVINTCYTVDTENKIITLPTVAVGDVVVVAALSVGIRVQAKEAEGQIVYSNGLSLGSLVDIPRYAVAKFRAVSPTKIIDEFNVAY